MDPEFLLRYGDIATKAVENLVLDRKVRLVFPEGEVLRDNFGRLLCYVEIQGMDIGERLLLWGHAIVYEAPHPREETYKLFQEEATKQRRGIWRKLYPPPQLNVAGHASRRYSVARFRKDQRS